MEKDKKLMYVRFLISFIMGPREMKRERESERCKGLKKDHKFVISQNAYNLILNLLVFCKLYLDKSLVWSSFTAILKK